MAASEIALCARALIKIGAVRVPGNPIHSGRRTTSQAMIGLHEERRP